MNDNVTNSVLIGVLDHTKLTGDKAPRVIVDDDTRSEAERLHDLKEQVFNKRKFLKVEDEVFCGRIIRRGERPDATRMDKVRRERAAEILTKANERLVFKMANKMYASMPQGTTKDDCVAAGMAGLARAIQGYDPDRGFKLSTYATQWIRHYLQRFSHAIARPGHVPSGKLMAVAKVHKEMERIRLDGETVNDETLNEVLDKYNLSLADYNKTALYNLGSMSMDASLADDSERNMGDILDSDTIQMSTMGEWSVNDVEGTVHDEMIHTMLHESVNRLPEQQKQFINSLFFNEDPKMGKTGELHKTNAQVRREMGITKDEADIALASAMQTLREAMLDAGYSEDELAR